MSCSGPVVGEYLQLAIVQFGMVPSHPVICQSEILHLFRQLDMVPYPAHMHHSGSSSIKNFHCH